MKNETIQIEVDHTLVVLKSNQFIKIGDSGFEPNKFYRFSHLDSKNVLVYGESMTLKKFESNFEFAWVKVMRDFKSLGMLKADNSPISKTSFKKLADIHTYTGGSRTLRIWFFRNTRDCIYGFYPMKDTLQNELNECYEWYLQLVCGNMDSLDDENVMFGNCGLPLTYGRLRTI
jgi:hypothetical protein